MNSLSWFIYLASVFGSIGTLVGIVLVFGGIAGIALTVAGIFIHCDNSYSSKSQAEKDKEVKFWEDKRKQCAAAACRVWVAWAVAAFLGIVIPDSKTMYAIAASEVGEQVVKSEAVQGITNDATKALQAWIKKQIEPEEKGKSK